MRWPAQQGALYESGKPGTQRHWQTLPSSAHSTRSPSNLGLFSSWQPQASIWCMPAELQCARRVHTAASLPAPMPSPCLPWHFVSLMGAGRGKKKKTAHCKRQVKCQTAYLYILISNNEAEYLPRIWCQWVLCRVDWALLLLFAFHLHENCTNRTGERITKLLEAKTPKRGRHLWIKKQKNKIKKCLRWH